MFQRPMNQPEHHIVTRAELTDARFKRFMREMSVYERKLTFDNTLNAFLDVYSTWMKTHQPDLKIRVVMLAFELHRLDPAFECTLSFAE